MSTSVPSPDVLFQRIDTKRVITLNRPQSLNALTLPMIRDIYPRLKEYEQPSGEEPLVDLVLMKGAGGKAFCAGGDVVSITKAAKAIKENEEVEMNPADFFGEEYRLNHLIGIYTLPFIAIIDGITMGGGVGLSVHAPFRVASERTVFAMPETAIGFFPDVGGTWFLPRLPNHLGMFLALTGERLKGRDVVQAGVATHFVDSSKLDALEMELMLMDPDKCSSDTVKLVLEKFHSQCYRSEEFSLKPHIEQIEKAFSADSVEEILERLTADGSDWAKKQIDTLSKMSPTALKVTHRQIQKGRELSFEDCFKLEFQLAQRFTEDNDFIEGVRAVLVDKCKSPEWNPKSLSEVTKKHVDWYFSPYEDPEKVLHLVK